MEEEGDDGGILPPAGEFKVMRGLLIALGILLLAAGLLWPVLVALRGPPAR